MNTPLYWKDLLAEFRALLDEYGDDVGIPNDDGSWTLESDHGTRPLDVLRRSFGKHERRRDRHNQSENDEDQ